MRNRRLVAGIALLAQLAAFGAAAEGTFFKNRKSVEPDTPPAESPANAQAAPLAQSAPAPAPVGVSGNVDGVVTTDTFVVGGQQIQLFGVVGEPTPYAEAVSQWLVANGNQMSCEPEGGRYRCFTPGGVDVGGVVIFNGAGKASADAPPEYQNAEQQARAGMKGVWQ